MSDHAHSQVLYLLYSWEPQPASVLRSAFANHFKSHQRSRCDDEQPRPAQYASRQAQDHRTHTHACEEERARRRRLSVTRRCSATGRGFGFPRRRAAQGSRQQRARPRGTGLAGRRSPQRRLKTNLSLS